MTRVEDIKKILIKNKNSLLQELRQSKEAMSLIKKSTRTKLTGTEKDKIKIHLLDICKTIPSLAIFLLPGGTFLLPLLIKLIPDILPSAFRDQEENQSVIAPKEVQ
ncbi:LETM1 domain-containing protein [uncultured Polaribacter sp.]|uniref:LETM1 domain-containing protein n=1 Tax=uncultured Polaribacter sp. TaxID=174711 RepID=UPI0030D74058|tara:strand:- start:192 stop:509 length:318 start_codon:yes stop_codon:yes gene_type:complete